MEGDGRSIDPWTMPWIPQVDKEMMRATFNSSDGNNLDGVLLSFLDQEQEGGMKQS